MKAPYAATLQAQQLSSMTSVATSLPSWTDLEKLDAVGHLLLEHRTDEHSLQAASSVLFDSFLKQQ